ncbi:uncharacterized protein LY89DRAFT_34616 [Mollisia scopiformis]|uniref:Uncharacterized protein n=1 Tax=Mollisia scopiformis TaxID=149040 RepID=A0A194XCT9_MOLSC|nr:uncharacterized protein LY89DRAFT_34616 [Mollisia scopiformis]KUJ17990.1 hypothetical protein LY89DRAFT_34616 [Mollisia scopiformis]
MFRVNAFKACRLSVGWTGATVVIVFSMSSRSCYLLINVLTAMKSTFGKYVHCRLLEGNTGMKIPQAAVIALIFRFLEKLVNTRLAVISRRWAMVTLVREEAPYQVPNSVTR